MIQIPQPSLPAAPFQIIILDRKYAERYCLQMDRTYTVTSVRYHLKNKEIRFYTSDQLFDFPWFDTACLPLPMFKTN
ncbi:hypothetical protein EF405_19095 [Cyclobacteriaceae bacterium YHN15]|nr:hypothetical protein EF405_19095 [Cyclobacteriaceae bacterium YHN15]